MPIREPSSMRQLYANHARMLRGERADGYDDEIHCGWYKTKMRKGGVFVPARVYVERDICPETCELTGPERLVLEIEGIAERDPLQAAIRFSFCRAITRAEYDALVKQRQFGPIAVDANEVVDLSRHPVFPQAVF